MDGIGGGCWSRVGGKDGASLRVSPAMVSPRSPAGDGDISSDTAAAEPAPDGGCSTPKAGQALPPSRPPQTLSPAEEPCPPWGVPVGTMAWLGSTGHRGDTAGTPQGTLKAQRDMSPEPRKGPRGALGTHQGSMGWVAEHVPSAGRGTGHPGEHLWGWEKDGAP